MNWDFRVLFGLLILFTTAANSQATGCSSREAARIISRYVRSNNPHQRLPRNIPEPYHHGYRAILDLLTSETRTLERLRELEDDVADRIWIFHESKFSAIDAVFEKFENRHQFSPAIILEPEEYAPEKWLAMLRGGALFYDSDWPTAADHGPKHHRAQWNIILRDMELHPGKYGKVTARELFTTMGDEAFLAALDWSTTGLMKENQSLWQGLLDSQFVDFTQPEKIDRMVREELPNLFDFLHARPKP